jgi:hypothetical protein
MGKVRSNFMGSQYEVFNDGVSPRDPLADGSGRRTPNGGSTPSLTPRSLTSGASEQLSSNSRETSYDGSQDRLSVSGSRPNTGGGSRPVSGRSRPASGSRPDTGADHSALLGVQLQGVGLGRSRSSPSRAHRNERGQATEVRKQLACVLFENAVMGERCPRKVIALVPAIVVTDGGEYESEDVIPTGDDDSLAALYKKKDLQTLVALYSKAPTWDHDLGAYSLDFGADERVTQASSKNMQLAPAGSDEVTLQFGRCDKDKFSLDFRHPLSPFQAFTMCLTSFDYKLGVE